MTSAQRIKKSFKPSNGLASGVSLGAASVESAGSLSVSVSGNTSLDEVCLTDKQRSHFEASSIRFRFFCCDASPQTATTIAQCSRGTAGSVSSCFSLPLTAASSIVNMTCAPVTFCPGRVRTFTASPGAASCLKESLKSDLPKNPSATSPSGDLTAITACVG